MAQPQEQPSRSPIRSSKLKMTPHTPSPHTNATVLSSPSITITTLGSDSGYESDARSGSNSPKEFPFHRRRTSSSAFSRKSSSSMNRPRSRASAYMEGDVVFDPLARSTPELSMEMMDPLDILKDPTPPQLFVSFSDPIPERPPLHLRERTVSTPTFGSTSSLGVALSGFAPIAKPETLQPDSLAALSLHQPTPPAPKPTAAHLGRSPLHKQPYRRPSEDPAWSLEEPVKPVTEDHVKALYQSPNYNIEELNEEAAADSAPEQDWPSESEVSPPAEPATPPEKPRQQHHRSKSAPSLLPPPITVPPPGHRLSKSVNLPPKPVLPPSVQRFSSTPAIPTTRVENEEGYQPHFEEERPWAGLNDLFLEATRVMTNLHSRSESSDSAFLAPPLPKTNPTTPPVTPVTAIPGLPTNPPEQEEDDDDSERNDDLASTLYDSSELVQPTSTTSKVVIKVVDAELPAILGGDSTKWGFMFFGLVGGMVLGSMLSRGRL